MAFLNWHFRSEVLDFTCAVHVILPQENAANTSSRRAKKYPVLWLLHGMSDDHTTWMRRTSIERYATSAGIAVIMPSAGLSWYQDMAAGAKYGTFLREELPRVGQSIFPISSARKDNFIAGLSMGGYGAFLLALSQPERFAAAASLSGALNVAASVHGLDKQWQQIVKSAFGDPDKVSGSKSDLLYLAKNLVRSGKSIPKLYACCGSKDFLLRQNHVFVTHAEKIGLPLTYEEHSDKSHEWGYWDQQIQRVLEWLPIPSNKKP